jgi:hypothetical protein
LQAMLGIPMRFAMANDNNFSHINLPKIQKNIDS